MIAKAEPPPPPRFPLGRCVATPGALEALEESGQSHTEFLYRHERGDWGDVDAEDQWRNEEALLVGQRVLSAYQTAKGTKIWIITDADRSLTTVMLPEEY